ncbi:sensor domain-containing diguanylate cyclase [Paraburkholderia sp.]|uniref:sensor domain-containing diguanylate cyclase n=1 Tax=Paraburkholderia sp. TaxID=1926495 RepID=UPI00238D53CD|nr:sensor domain-containing diguanylate cyclase [Paraburkholderia sp.]MDE1181850.1 sensor domain-containing diguanylate cyclase [Paraburkholderia sp.]
MCAAPTRVRDPLPDSVPLFLIPALTCVVLCVLWITILARLHTERANELRDTRNSANTLAAALQTHTLKTIHDIDEIALLVKYGYEDGSGNFDLGVLQARGLITSDTALQVTLVGADGRVIASTLPVGATVDISDREHFAVHRRRADAGLFISRPMIGRVSKKWSIQATRRLDRPDGSFGGVVVVSEDPASLTGSFYNPAALGAQGLVSVLSRAGFRLSRRAGGRPGDIVGPAPHIYLDLLKHGDGEVIDPIDGVERIVAVRSIDQYGLVVVAGLSVAEALEDYVRMRNGYLTMAAIISLMLSGFAIWVMVLIRQLTTGREALRCLSQTDRLTGLPNRGHMTDLLEHAVARSDAPDRIALIFVDLDNFKALNDTCGHHAGDEALVVLAQRLRASVGELGIAGRFGGDEFIVVIDADDAAATASAIVCRIDAALDGNGTYVSADIGAPTGMPSSYRPRCDAGHLAGMLRASVGVAVRDDGETAADLLKKADHAMYDAKRRRQIEEIARIAAACETGRAESGGGSNIASNVTSIDGHMRRRYRDVTSVS